MRQKILLILLFTLHNLFAVSMMASEDNSLPPVCPIIDDSMLDEEFAVYVVVDTMPEFPGGVEALKEYIYQSISYPTEMYEKGIEARVVCQFIVNEDGTISDAQIICSEANKLFEEEVLRVVYAMPKWKPGRHRGKVVRVAYNVPFNFRIGHQ